MSAARVPLSRKLSATYPPLPDRFRARMPDPQGIETRLVALAGQLGVSVVDHRSMIPDPRFYFDTDHLNRVGVELWPVDGLGDILRRPE